MPKVYSEARDQGVFITVAGVVKRNPASPVIQLWGRKLLSLVEVAEAKEASAKVDKRRKKEEEQILRQRGKRKKGASIEVLED